MYENDGGRPPGALQSQPDVDAGYVADVVVGWGGEVVDV